MARSILADLLQSHRFWLLDIVPSITYPFFVLGSPMYGFNSITVPEYTFDTREVKQLNSMHKRTVYEGGGWGTITLTRGVRLWDDTFYTWAKRAIDGTDTIDRNLLLIQYGGINADAAGQVNTQLLTAILGGVGNPVGAVMSKYGGAMDQSYMLNVPGLAMLLWGCVPTRFKPTSDLDATSAEIAIQEIELAVHAASIFYLLGTN